MQKTQWEYDAKIEGDFKKLNCNDKMKKHTKKTPREEHFVRDVREFYPDLKEARHNDLDIPSAIKLGKKYYEQVIDNERRSEIDVEPSKSMLNNTKGWKGVENQGVEGR